MMLLTFFISKHISSLVAIILSPVYRIVGYGFKNDFKNLESVTL